MGHRFVIVNVMLISIAFAAYCGGLLDSVFGLGPHENILLGALAVYGCLGLVAATLRRWNVVSHIANGAPMLALGMTGLGMLSAANALHTITPDALAVVFRDMAFSIAPNIFGVLIMVWLREIAYWSADEEI